MTSRRQFSCGLVSCLAVCFVAHAEAAVWYLGGAANAPGARGTHFSTELHILSRGDVATTVRFRFVPFTGETPPETSRPLAARGTIGMKNALAELWGIEGAGVLEIESEEPLSFRASTYNDAAPPGTFGTALTAVRHDQLLENTDSVAPFFYIPWVSHSADPARDYRTNLLVFFATPYSGASVGLRTPNGYWSRQVDSAESARVVQFSVADMLQGETADLGKAWAELQNFDGRGLAFASVVDNVTGDGIAVPATLAPVSARTVYVNGVAKASGLGETFYRTDVRLMNLDDLSPTVKVRVTPIGFVASAVEISLRPGELREITDVLGSLFGAPEGTTGALRLDSDQPILVVARTSNVKRSGEPGTFGAFQAGVPEDAFLIEGDTGIFAGLVQSSDRPGYRTNIGLLAGPDGALAQLTLRGPSGEILGSVPDLRLEPSSWRQPGLGSLFPGVEIPAESSLFIDVLEGSMDAYSSVIDNETGDAVVSPVDHDEASTCQRPAISAVTLWPGFVTPGNYGNLDVDSTGATSVSVEPSAGIVPYGFGRFNIEPATAPRVVKITAAGPCGSVSRTVTVPAGTPAFELTPSELAPLAAGQVRFANIFEPGRYSDLTLEFADGWRFGLDLHPTSTPGVFTFLMPYIPDSGSPEGYRTGVASIVSDDPQLPSVKAMITIKPLAFSGDPVAAFRTFLGQRTADMRAVFQQERGLPGMTSATATQEALFDSYLALVSKLADDLTVSDSAQMPSDLPSQGEPSPPLVTVTRADLSRFVALMTNMNASIGTFGGAARRSPSQSAIPCTESGCAASDPLVCECLASHSIDIDGWIDWVANGISTALRLGAPGEVIAELVRTGLGTLLSHWIAGVESARAHCPAIPVWTKNFIPFNPEHGNKIPPGGANIRFDAYLENAVTSAALADYLESRFVRIVTTKFTRKLPASLRGQAADALRQVLARQRKGLREHVQRLSENLGGISAEARKVPVCRADFFDYYFVSRGDRDPVFGTYIKYTESSDPKFFAFLQQGPYMAGEDTWALQPLRGRMLVFENLDVAGGYSATRQILGEFEVLLKSDGDPSNPRNKRFRAGFSVGNMFESIYDVSGNQEVQLQAPALLGTAGRTVITPDRCPCGRPCTVINFAGDRLASIKACAGSARSFAVFVETAYSVKLGKDEGRYRKLTLDMRMNAPNGTATVGGWGRDMYMPLFTAVDGKQVGNPVPETRPIGGSLSPSVFLTSGFEGEDSFEVTG
ncbi:MAG: hypothetical protein L6R30_23060, partial [Thermoanaerobaculia bacterium]|nr:hypothetical protein [Thermoanaerobaculia bacterium]